MGAFRDSITREIRRFGRSRMLVTVTVILPFTMTLLYALMFWDGTLRSLPITVYDGDKTEVSRQLIRMINATPSANVSFRVESIEQGKQTILDGLSNALIVIPQGLQESIYSGNEQAEITAEISGARILSAGLLKRDIATVFQAMNIGVETQMLGSKGIPAEKGYQMAYPIAFERHILFNPYGSYAYYLLPGLLHLMLIILVSLTTAYVIGSELKDGSAAEWVETAGGSIGRALAGKLAPYLLLFTIISLFMNTVLYRYMGLPFDDTGAITIVILGNIFLIMSHMAISVILVALSANMRFSLSISGGLATASFSLCGLTFPALAMYPVIRGISTILPLTHYVNLFIEQSMRGAPPATALGDLAYLGILIMLSAIVLPRLKKVSMDPKYYGRS